MALNEDALEDMLKQPQKDAVLAEKNDEFEVYERAKPRDIRRDEIVEDGVDVTGDVAGQTLPSTEAQEDDDAGPGEPEAHPGDAAPEPTKAPVGHLSDAPAGEPAQATLAPPATLGQPAATPKPEPATAPPAAPEPEQAPVPQPVQEPALEPVPGPAPEPPLEPVREPAPEPALEPVQESAPQTVPEPAEQALEPALEPAPEPTLEPTPPAPPAPRADAPKTAWTAPDNALARDARPDEPTEADEPFHPEPAPQAPARKPSLDEPWKHGASRGTASGGGCRIGIVQSDFNHEITDQMAEWATRHADKLGAEVSAHVHVPGAFDTPLAALRLARRDDVDAVVVLGCVVQGETGHDEVITHAVAGKLLDIACDTGKPVGFGITGPRMTWAQAEARVGVARFAVESAVAQWQLAQ